MCAEPILRQERKSRDSSLYVYKHVFGTVLSLCKRVFNLYQFLLMYASVIYINLYSSTCDSKTDKKQKIQQQKQSN